MKRYFITLITLHLVIVKIVFAGDTQQTSKVSREPVAQSTAMGVDVRLQQSQETLNNKSLSEKVRADAILELSRIHTLASTKLLIENIGFTRNVGGSPDAPVEEILFERGEEIVEPLLTFMKMQCTLEKPDQLSLRRAGRLIYELKRENFIHFVEEHRHEWSPMMFAIITQPQG